MVYSIWYILLDVQGSCNQARTVVINHSEAPEVELARLQLRLKCSYCLVIATLVIQVVGDHSNSKIPELRRTYVCVYIYIDIHIYIYAYVYVYAHRHTHTCVCVYIYVYICVHIVYICKCL